MIRYTLRSAAACVLLAGLGAQGPATAAEVQVVAANLPPMMFEDGTGREAELISATLDACDQTARFQVEPFTRHWKSFKDGAGDAVSTVPPGFDIGAITTTPYIEFQNGVSFLSSRALEVSSLEDLAGMNVVAFGGASQILPGLDTAKDSFKSYREVTDQIVQSRLLFAGRTDAVIGDGMLFAEYNRELAEKAGDLNFDPTQPVTFSKIFEPSPYVMAFRDEGLARAFEGCFAELEKAGTIDAINTKWVEKYRDVLGTEYLGY